MRTNLPLRKTLATALFDLLVKFCGAKERDRQKFMFHFCSLNHAPKWDFLSSNGEAYTFWHQGHWKVNTFCVHGNNSKNVNRAIRLLLKGWQGATHVSLAELDLS